MIKAAIIDDENNGREMLKQLLKKHFTDIEVIGVAHSVESAVKLINNTSPDIVFLDIEMPNGSGFDVLRALETITFDVIFVTAHQHYAIKAIKHSAMDYILKPIDIDDLKEAVARFKNKNLENQVTGNNKIKYSFNSLTTDMNGHPDSGEVQLNSLFFNFIFREIKDSTGNVIYKLTKKESLLLKLLYDYRETYLRREIALKRIWGDSDFYTSRSMDVYIARLRKFLEDHDIKIVNIYGDGFRITT